MRRILRRGPPSSRIWRGPRAAGFSLRGRGLRKCLRRFWKTPRQRSLSLTNYPAMRLGFTWSAFFPLIIRTCSFIAGAATTIPAAAGRSNETLVVADCPVLHLTAFSAGTNAHTPGRHHRQNAHGGVRLPPPPLDGGALGRGEIGNGGIVSAIRSGHRQGGLYHHRKRDG